MSLFFLSLFIASAVSICYYPDGSTAPQDTPCNNHGGNTTCCGQGYACLSNTICMSVPGLTNDPNSLSSYIRGSCTDKSWLSPDCPLFCLDPKVDNISGGEGISKCQNTDTDSYCCVDDTLSACNCSSGSSALRFQGTPSALTTIGFTPSTPSSSATSAQTSSSASSTSLSSSLVTSSATIASSTLSSISSASSQPTPIPTSSLSTVNSAAIGAGVGVPVGLLIIGATMFYFYRSRKNRKPNPAPIRQKRVYEIRGGPSESLKFKAHPQLRDPYQGNEGPHNEILGNTGESELPEGPNTHRYELPSKQHSPAIHI